MQLKASELNDFARFLKENLSAELELTDYDPDKPGICLSALIGGQRLLAYSVPGGNCHATMADRDLLARIEREWLLNRDS